MVLPPPAGSGRFRLEFAVTGRILAIRPAAAASGETGGDGAEAIGGNATVDRGNVEAPLGFPGRIGRVLCLGHCLSVPRPGDAPGALFVAWLRTAIERGVPEPHLMTLSTVDNIGRPSSRALILKDVEENGWLEVLIDLERGAEVGG